MTEPHTKLRTRLPAPFVEDDSRNVEFVTTRWRLAADVGRTLASGRDPSIMIAEVLRMVVPAAADCLVIAVGGTDVPPVLEIAHVDAAAASTMRDRIPGSFRDASADVGRVLAAMRSGSTELEDAGALRAMLTSLGVTWAAVMPVILDGRVEGLVLLGVVAARDASAADGEFAHLLADHVGMALEQNRLLRRGRAALAARDRAVSIVSHDLRNPLSTIQICATALLDPVPASPDGVRRTAELIQRSAVWMQHIVRDLLDRASLDSGRLTLHRELIDVAELIRSIDGLFGPIANERAIRLVLASPDDLPPIVADPDRLLQALSNLVGNALRFTPRGGRVELTASRGTSSAAEVHFAIRDTGPGIEPENVAHVFDWLWRTPDDRGAGVGLGLAIAKGLIEAHEGQLRVESVPGSGSTFSFTLPAARSESGTPQEREMAG